MARRRVRNERAHYGHIVGRESTTSQAELASKALAHEGAAQDWENTNAGEGERRGEKVSLSWWDWRRCERGRRSWQLPVVHDGLRSVVRGSATLQCPPRFGAGWVRCLLPRYRGYT
eukprot:6202301-Pleurochrysis_carterae.AAC.2